MWVPWVSLYGCGTHQGMSSFISDQAATSREKARGADGKFGQQTYTRAGSIDLDDATVDQAPHPAEQPETNPVLAHVHPESWYSSTYWHLDADDAARYAASIDSAGARRLAQIGAEDYRVNQYGRFDTFLEPGDGNTYLLEAQQDSVLLLLSAESSGQEAKAAVAGITIDSVEIDATTGRARELWWLCDVDSADGEAKNSLHPMRAPQGDLPTDDLSIQAWSPKGVQDLSDTLTADGNLWEMRRQAADDYTQRHCDDPSSGIAAPMEPHPTGEQPISMLDTSEGRDPRMRKAAEELAAHAVTARAVPAGRKRIDMGFSVDRTVVHYYRPTSGGQEQHLAIEHLTEDPDPHVNAAAVLSEVTRDSTYADQPLDSYVADYGYDEDLELDQAVEDHQKIIDDTRRARAFFGDDTIAALRDGAHD